MSFVFLTAIIRNEIYIPYINECFGLFFFEIGSASSIHGMPYVYCKEGEPKQEWVSPLNKCDEVVLPE